MNSTFLKRRLTLVCLVLIALAPAWGQSTGRLAGLVKDQTGAAVADAIVSLYRPAMTDAAVQAKTTGAGLFEFDALPPESYRVMIEKAGFAAYEVKDVKLSPGTETPLNNIVLALGQQPTVVTASERLTGIQTGNAEISTSLSTEQLEDLPILNRDPLGLVKTQAGVVYGAAGAYTTINGLRTSYSNVTLDGINIQDNTVRYNGLDVVANNIRLGQVNQFTLVTSNQAAIYGNGATQAAFVSPSGTNELHGSAFYLNSANPLNANTWFQDSRNLSNAYKSNQAGFNVGGPLIREKLFGYAEWESYRLRDTFGRRATTLSDATRALSNPTGNPILAVLINEFPRPNLANGTQYAFGQAATADFDNAVARLDYIPSQRSTFVASYFWNRLNTVTSPSVYSTQYGAVQHAKASLISGSWRFTPSPRLTNEIRGGINIAPIAFINEQRTAPYILDLNAVEANNPVLNFANNGRKLKTLDFQDNANYSFGRHNLQFGFQTQIIRVDSYLENGSVPTVYLGDPNVASCTFRCALSDQYYGLVQRFFPVNNSGVFAAAPEQHRLGEDNFAPYVQDNWKITRKVALTLGLRWDYFTPVSDEKGLFYVPRVASPYAIGVGSVQYDLRGGSLYRADKNNLAPSIGLAIDPTGTGRTAFRMAYGISYVNDDLIESVRFTLGENAFDLGGNGFFGSDALPLPSSVPPVSPPDGGRTIDEPFFNGRVVATVDPHLRTPYVQQWSASVQQEVRGFLIDARYIGNRAAKLLRQDRFPSAGNDTFYLAGSSSSTYSGFQIDVNRRLRKGLQLQANYTLSKTLTDSNTYTSIFIDSYRDPTNHRLDKGPAVFDIRNAFKTNLIYELPFGRSGDGWKRGALGGWSVSTILLAQSGAPFSIVTGNGNQTANTLIGGGDLSRIVSFHMTGNGPSIIAPSAINTDGTGVGGFTGQVFLQPPPGSPGLLQPRSFYGPASFDWDLGMQKRFRITERQNLELRCVAVNVLNHASFGFNNQNINSSSFGFNNRFTLFPPRTVQLSAYYRF